MPGELLYATLLKFGLAEGEYRADPADGLRLKGAIILNAVKCLPPQNKTLPHEEANCRPVPDGGDRGAAQLTTFIALGKVAHDSLCRSFGVPLSRAKFAHGAEHVLPGGKRLIDSYHCSRYNQNTGGSTRRCSRRCSRLALRWLRIIRTERLLLRRARMRRSGRHPCRR